MSRLRFRRHKHKFKKRSWVILDMVYDSVRRFRADYDINEDFVCAYCMRPVFRRIMTCSKECYDKLSDEITEWKEEQDIADKEMFHG